MEVYEHVQLSGSPYRFGIVYSEQQSLSSYYRSDLSYLVVLGVES